MGRMGAAKEVLRLEADARDYKIGIGSSYLCRSLL